MKWNRDMNATKQCVHLLFSEATWKDGWVYGVCGAVALLVLLLLLLPLLLLKYHCLCYWTHQKRNNKSVLCCVSFRSARINIYGERAHTHYIHCCAWMNGIHWIPFHCCEEGKETRTETFALFNSRVWSSSRAFSRTPKYTHQQNNNNNNNEMKQNTRFIYFVQ